MKYLLSVAAVVACTSMAALTAPSLAQTAPGAPAAASGTPTAPPYMPNVLLGPAPVPFPPPVSIKDQGSYLPDQYAEYYIAGAPAWNAFIDTDLGIQDWWVHSVNHEVSAGVAQDRTYDFEYLKPRYAFAHIVAGNDAGEAGVWHGGLKTRGHLNGAMAGLKAVTPTDDPRVTDIVGHPIFAAFFPWMINGIELAGGGKITETPGPTIDGEATTQEEIQVLPSVQKGDAGCTIEQIFLSTSTHLPVEHDCYVGTDHTQHEVFSGYKINTGLTPEHFNF